MAKRKQMKEGFGKLLDAWVPPEDAGEAVGVIATTFTFDAAFFEEECLASFLGLETNPTDDGPAYLIEREEKLARLQCASVLVDAHHCRGTRSLRWDLLPARLTGIQHAKVSLLIWSNHIRLMIGSANLTEDGYRRNLEVFGVLDFHPGSDSPIECLLETTGFLRRGLSFCSTTTPAARRWTGLLGRVETDCATWGTREVDRGRSAVQVKTLFIEPSTESGFDQLKAIWPASVGPKSADIFSPFFDSPESENIPVDQTWSLLRQRGQVTASYHVASEESTGWEELGHRRWILHAPESLCRTPRQSASVEFARVTPPDARPLHAKGIWLQDDRYAIYQIGSSNFTSAGMGIGKRSNLEANLVYVLDGKRDEKLYQKVEATFPKSEPVDPEDVVWQPMPSDEDAEALTQIALPAFFGDAVYDLNENNAGRVTLQFAGNFEHAFELFADGTEKQWFDSQEWNAKGKPGVLSLPWTKTRPPSGFDVRIDGHPGTAWWPVNVRSADALPPPDELKDLPLQILLDLLGSSRPLHRVMADYLFNKAESEQEENISAIDPHSRVDTSGFLLQRTRRLSWALIQMRERIERPAATIETLNWRLYGPVGVLALADAITREATSQAESAFLLAELALELSRAEPGEVKGYVDAATHRAEVGKLIEKLRNLVRPEDATQEGPENLRKYVETVFDEVVS